MLPAAKGDTPWSAGVCMIIPHETNYEFHCTSLAVASRNESNISFRVYVLNISITVSVCYKPRLQSLLGDESVEICDKIQTPSKNDFFSVV